MCHCSSVQVKNLYNPMLYNLLEKFFDIVLFQSFIVFWNSYCFLLQVQWLSVYEALDAVYRTMDSLLFLFSTCNDVKAMGFKKKLGEDFFVYTTYSMMDVLRPVMALNQFFSEERCGYWLCSGKISVHISTY